MSKDKKTQLGKILLKQKLVNSDQLESLLNDKQDGERLASKALESGLIDEVKALKALSEQHGLPATNLDEVEISVEILAIIPQDIALKHLVLPISVSADTIHLAMANPDERRVVDEIEFVSGKRVFPHVALHSQLSVAIDKCYRTLDAGETVYRGKHFGRPRPPSAVPPPPVEDPGAAGAVIADSSQNSELDLSVDIDIPVDEDSQVVQLVDPGVEAPEIAPEPAAHLVDSPPSAQAIEDAAPKDKGDPDALTVLVVDDEDDIRLLITRVLSDKGYNVVTASRGREAIQQVQAQKPDMIVLDAMLPEVHGFDICKKIKSSTKYGHIPVIMISAIYRGWRYAQDLKDSYGVDDFIEKPFKIGELIEKVEKHSRASTPELESRTEELSKEAEHSLTAGINAYKEGNLDEAIDFLKNGVNIDPLAFKLHYHLALLLGKKGLSYQAIRSLENALELAPDYFPALKNLAVLYQKAGFKFKAIETWEKALGFCTDEETREGIKNHLVSLL